MKDCLPFSTQGAPVTRTGPGLFHTKGQDDTSPQRTEREIPRWGGSAGSTDPAEPGEELLGRSLPRRMGSDSSCQPRGAEKQQLRRSLRVLRSIRPWPSQPRGHFQRTLPGSGWRGTPVRTAGSRTCRGKAARKGAALPRHGTGRRRSAALRKQEPSPAAPSRAGSPSRGIAGDPPASCSSGVSGITGAPALRPRSSAAC